MATLSQNSTARGAARKSGIPIVNAVPTVRANPILPTVNLATRTYSGPAPRTAVAPADKGSGVNLNGRFSLTPTSGQTNARSMISAEQQRRQGNRDLERTRDSEVARLNNETRAAAKKAADDAETKLRAAGVTDNEKINQARLDAENKMDDNYTVVGVPGGGTKIIKQKGYDPTTGYYKTAEDVAGKAYMAQSRPGAFGVSSGAKGAISGADSKIASIKEAMAGAVKNPGEDDYSYQIRMQTLQGELQAAQQEKDSATSAATRQQQTEQSLTPDVLAMVESATKSKTGRIQAETGIDPVSAAPDYIQQIFQEHPEMAQVYEPLVEALARDDKQQAQALFGVLSRLDKQGDRAASVAEDAIAAAKEFHIKLADQSKESYDIQRDIAKENKAQAEFEKAQYEHQQGFLISQKMDEAADNEMSNRRAAAAMGFTSDTNGLSSMQREARRAQDTISFLQSETNMTTAEMGRRITSTYSLSVRDLAQKYDATLLQLDTSLTNSLSDIQGTLNLGDEKRAEAFQGAYQSYLNKVSTNDIKTAEIYGGMVEKLNDQAFELKKINMQEQRADTRMMWQDTMADKKMQFQEAQTDKRLSFQESNADKRLQLQINSQERQQANQDKKIEMASADDIRTQVRGAMTNPDVQTYQQIASAASRMHSLLDDLTKSSDPNKIGAAKQLALTLVAKASDPTTGVREGELTKFGKNATWVQRVMQANNAIFGGDTTGLSLDAVKSYEEMLDLMNTDQKQRADAVLMPAINSIITHNNRAEYFPLNPADIVPSEFLDIATEAASSYYNKDNSYNKFDYGKYSTGVSSIGENDATDPVVVDSLLRSMKDTGMTIDQIDDDFYGRDGFDSPQAKAVIEASPTESVGDIFSQFGDITQNFSTAISANNYSSGTVKAWGGKHLGLDIAMPKGAIVPSMTEGTLLAVEYSPGWGLSATIKADDGTQHRYSHLLAINPYLKIGGRLEKGQEFAEVGNTGNVFSAHGGDGTHLDYRIRQNGKYIDPFSYFS